MSRERRREKGEGGLYQRADGRWVAAVSIGRGKRRVLYGRTEAEAKKKLKEAQRSHLRGEPLARSRQTTSAYLRLWLDGREGTVRPRTMLRYRQSVEAHVLPACGDIPLTSLTTADIQAMLAHLTSVSRSICP